jgi:eukaryotic-like serine/threonine-protein kinase
MTAPDTMDVEARALALLERLIMRPQDARYRERLLRRQPPEVLARLAQLEAVHTGNAARMTQMFAGALPAADPPAPPPERFGPFRILEPLGSGGMGQVWRAERADGLFEQTVAIKLIQPHLLGRASTAFEAERRILAKLEHPNIARIIDGGLTADGRSCLVMEYVDGVGLDEAAAPRALAQKLGLFQQIIAAVQYAHSRLIAHGDLKPSNIMVDTEGRVRLLDFGIARLLTDDAQAAQLSGAVTASYASPQRLAGAPPSISHDVFALGRLLEKLVADTREADLNAIAAKASASEEADRYVDAPSMLADLERWQNHYPVHAIRQGLRYRLGKYVRRNWKGVAAFTVVSAALVVAVLGYVQAERQRTQAEARFAQTRSMANFMLFDLYDKLDVVPGTTAARAQIAQRSAEHLQTLAQSTGISSDVRFDVARGLARLALVTGGSSMGTLGKNAQSLHLQSQADTLLTALLKANPNRRDYRLALAELKGWRCINAVFIAQDTKLAERLAKEATTLADIPGDAQARELLFLARKCQANLLFWLNKTAQAKAVLAPELQRAEERAKATGGGLAQAKAMAEGYRMLGGADLDPDNLSRSLTVFQRGLDVLKPYDSVIDREMLYLRYILNFHMGWSLNALGRSGEALVYFRKSRAALEQSVISDPSDANAQSALLVVKGSEARALGNVGSFRQAIALVSEAYAQATTARAGRVLTSEDQRGIASLMLSAGQIYRAKGDTANACAWFAKLDRHMRDMDAAKQLSDYDRVQSWGLVKQRLAKCPPAR